MVIDVNLLTNVWTIAGVIASFFVAVIALSLGLYSNWRFSNMRRVEKMERCLKEIIDWALEVIEFTTALVPLKTTDVVGLVQARAPTRTIQMAVAHDKEAILNRLSAKGTYLEALIPRLFSNIPNLLLLTNKVDQRIDEHLRFLSLIMTGKVKNVEISSAIHLVRFRQNALKLVELSVDVYTRIK